MEINIVSTTEDQELSYALRREVFVQEQHVPVQIEIDEFEKEAIHFLGKENGEAVVASRLRFVDGFGKLERICVKKEYRGRNFGQAMIEAMEAEIKRQNYTEAKLNAQINAVAFYEKSGYKVISEEFLDAGIPHVTMTKQL